VNYSRPASTAGAAACAAAASEQVGSELARELRRRWCAGANVTSEAVLAEHPELWNDPESAVELIYEEFCLREAAGDDGARADLLARFPQWADALAVMLDCHHRIIESDRDRPRFPASGERLGEFRLRAELSRGARGRVFLAAQAALADRPVVLKVTPLDGAEHLSLARLQHTNIVPLYSVTDDAARNVRVLCMPYFGRATLASLLAAMSDVAPAARTGANVVAAIDALQEPAAAAASSSPPPAAARQMLASVSYVQAMCWITACLADALQFAHERGVVHLDLKPSNILLASDGQPMLLDFHLAREPVRAGSSVPDNLGGTPPYMPPEQRTAMAALQAGHAVPSDVDGRADIFALGAMLYEALGGSVPIGDDARPLAGVNERVSEGLSDIVARCLAPRAQDRYADAAALADDLRRHLTDQPLVGVANRSLVERWQKWRRRRPSALRSAAMAAAAACAVVVLVGGARVFLRERHQQAEASLRDGRELMRHSGNSGEAVRTLERGFALVEAMPFAGELRQQLHDELAAAKREYLAVQLHQLADEVRALYGAESVAPARLVPLAQRCRTLWQQRGAVIASLGEAANPNASHDLLDVALFAAHVSAKDPGRRADAIVLLDEAETSFGPSAVIAQERTLLGAPARAGDSPPKPRDAWERYAMGRALLATDDLLEASQHLSAARQLDPSGRWPNFYYGLCAFRMDRHDEAVAAFSACIGAAPNAAGCFYNRGLAYAGLRRTDEALSDYTRALQLDPAHAAAALNRGMLYEQLRRTTDAISDLELALKNGADPATVHYDLALVYASASNRASALRHARLAAESNPQHPRAAQLADTLRREIASTAKGADNARVSGDPAHSRRAGSR